MCVCVRARARAFQFQELKFYYSIFMTISDGSNSISTIVQINQCFPEVDAGGGNFDPDRAPEFVTVSVDGTTVTRHFPAPPADIVLACHYLEACVFTVYAGHFADDSGTALSDRTTTIEPANPTARVQLEGPPLNGTQVCVGGGSARARVRKRERLTLGRAREMQVYRSFASLGPSIANGPGGVVSRNVSFGRASTGFTAHEQADIGAYHSMCFKAKTEGIACWSVPLCIKVKILGSAPIFVAPTPPLDLGLPLDIGVPTPVAVCFGSTGQDKRWRRRRRRRRGWWCRRRRWWRRRRRS